MNMGISCKIILDKIGNSFIHEIALTLRYKKDRGQVNKIENS